MELSGTARMRVGLGVVLALTAGLYLGGGLLSADFAFEDHLSIMRGNPEIPLPPGRVLTLASFWVDARLGGHPWIYHLHNLLIHLLNGYLLFWVAQAFFAPALSLLVAAVFLLHPLQTEAVLYISGRSDLQATAIGLAAVGLILHRNYRWTPGVVAGLALAVLTAGLIKPAALVVIGLMGLAWTAVLQRERISYYPPLPLWGRVGLLIVAILGVAVTLTQIRDVWTVMRGDTMTTALGPLAYFNLQATALGYYLFAMAIPMNQSVAHDFELIPWTVQLGAGLWFALMTILVFDAWIRERWKVPGRVRVALFGALWLAISILPRFVIRIPEVLNEQHLYMGMAGTAMLIGTIVTTKEERISCPMVL